MTTDVTNLDGPRAVAADELPRVMELIDGVFAADGPVSMFDRFPVLFAADNLENCRVIFGGSRPVSHAAYLPCEISFHETTISAACLGAVCTDENYRGRGLSTAVLNDCEVRMRRRGIELLLISGRRGLYERRGARTVGSRRRIVFTRDLLDDLEDDMLDIRPAGPDDLEILASLYASGPVHFVRSTHQWKRWLACERCENATSRPLLAMTTDGRPTAYVVHKHTNFRGEPISSIGEYAGDTVDVISTLATAPRLTGRRDVVLDMQLPLEETMRERLSRGGLNGEAAQGDRTVKVLQPAALFEKCRRWMPPATHSMTVADAPSGLRFTLKGDELEVPAESVARLLFGDPEGALIPRLRAKGHLGRVVSSFEPFPLPRYGYNYT
jgi:GNAT superfamily N-acetyltransferase